MDELFDSISGSATRGIWFVGVVSEGLINGEIFHFFLRKEALFFVSFSIFQHIKGPPLGYVR